MKVNPSIFKKYDIRGIVPTDLDETVAHAIGRAYATFMQHEQPGKKLQIVVGNDMRLSSPQIKAKLIEGLLETGIDVVDIGLVTTPTFYFGVAFNGYDGGVQVSASHNPKEYNGFKMVRARAVPISGDTGIQEIRSIVECDSYVSGKGHGTIVEKHGVVAECFREESKGIGLSRIKPLTIVVDAANAMGGLDIETTFKSLPCKLVKMNFELDGTFPSHQPDPLNPENLIPLQRAVREHHADLGIAPDGDGDRYFLIDEQGEVVRQEILRGVMAQLALKDHPRATVCYDIRPGRITRDMIEAAGGRAVVTPVGHSLIKEVMLREHAVFGGESSGHYFYEFPFGTFEAPMTLLLKFFVWLSERGTTLSGAIEPYRKYHHSGEINSTVSDVATTLGRVREHYKDARVDLLDGVTIEYGDWWFNVRGSNTEPLVRLNLEATSRELMEQKRDEVLNLIRS